MPPKLAKLLPDAELMDEIQAKALRVFLLAIHSHLYSFALRFIFLQTHATSYSFYSLATLHCKGERTIKPYPLPFGLRNLKSENSPEYAKKPQRNCASMNSVSVLWGASVRTYIR